MRKTAQENIPEKIDMDEGSFPLAHAALLTLAKTKLSGAQRAIVDVIFTQTYGYHNEASRHKERIKKRHTQAQISHEFFMQAAWMGKPEVSRAINTLLKWNIIGRDKNTLPYTYWFNVQAGEWASECWRVSRIANTKSDTEQTDSITTQPPVTRRAANIKQTGLLQVSRIANSNQDSKPAVSRLANGKQDSKQLAGQLTRGSQDSEQSVSRIANSKQSSAQQLRGLQLPLKKEERNIKRNNTPPTPPKGVAPQTDPGVKQVISHYHARFVERFGEKPVIDGPKDGAIVKKLLQSIDADKLCFLLDRFFASKDPWIQNSGYTIGVFKTQVNKLLVQAKGGTQNGRASPSRKEFEDFFIN